jgi:RNA polymerase sigma-70 factor (ECF subfamily)
VTADGGVDDLALVRASQRGDRDAFGTLVSRHAARILTLTSRMLGSTGEAEDVAQDTFVAAYRSLAGFQHGARFSTWLYRIAVNKCHDALRARRPGTISIDADEESADAVALEIADGQTPLWELEQVELAWELDQAIGALPAVYRESFILKHIEGMEYDEMSEVLGINRDALKMRVYKARTLLCRSLAHLATR